MECLKLRLELQLASNGFARARRVAQRRAWRACGGAFCCSRAAGWICTSSRNICLTSPPTFFPDGRSERQPVPGTVARGQLRLDELFYTGKENGVEADQFPFPITRADLERGRERYNIYCTPCHDYTGNGNGLIVQRGFPLPPSYHIQRLREAPVGHFLRRDYRRLRRHV